MTEHDVKSRIAAVVAQVCDRYYIPVFLHSMETKDLHTVSSTC